MAKIIRCPNCGENVEVPPNPTGQIVTCVACGTAMRLKSKKDGDKSRDSSGSLSGSSVGGSLSGSMSATRITSESVQASGDDPPDLGSTCDVCGKPVDPSDLTEDRGKLVCRDCFKGARSSRPRALKGVSDDELIPFSRAPDMGPRRRRMITFGMPFFAGTFAVLILIACNAYLAFNPKPVGKTALAKPDEPPPAVPTAWDEKNKPVIERMMSEARTLKAYPNTQADARAKYAAVVDMARGQSIGSQDVRALIDEAEREVEALARATGTPPPDATTPLQGTPPAPPTEAAFIPPPAPPANDVPDNVAPQANSLFDDPEVEITDKLNTGLSKLEGALSAEGAAAHGPAKEALIKFSEARGLLIREKRNFPEDPGWTFANHGSAVAFLLSGDYENAIRYLDRLPSPPDRAALINRVVALLRLRENKAEAIQLLLAYLGNEQHADDAYALNLLGTALARYPAEVIKDDEALSAAQKTYDELVKKVGSKHPGERRWGVRWIPANEYEAKHKERRIHLNTIQDLERALLKVQTRIGDKQKILDRGGFLRPEAQQELAAQKAEQARLTQRIEAERKLVPLEEWLTPEQIIPVLPEVTAVNVRGKGAASRPATNAAGAGA